MTNARLMEGLDYDLTVIEEACRELGYEVWHNVPVHDYYHRVAQGGENCDLMVKSTQHRFEIGFVKQKDGTVTMIADNHRSHVTKDMANNVLPTYIQRMGKRLAHGRQWKVKHKEKVRNTVTLRLGRG